MPNFLRRRHQHAERKQDGYQPWCDTCFGYKDFWEVVTPGVFYILRGRRDVGEDCCCVEVHFPAFKTFLKPKMILSGALIALNER